MKNNLNFYFPNKDLIAPMTSLFVKGTHGVFANCFKEESCTWCWGLEHACGKRLFRFLKETASINSVISNAYELWALYSNVLWLWVHYLKLFSHILAQITNLLIRSVFSPRPFWVRSSAGLDILDLFWMVIADRTSTALLVIRLQERKQASCYFFNRSLTC